MRWCGSRNIYAHCHRGDDQKGLYSTNLQSPLRQFWERHQQAEAPLKAWFGIADKAAWKTPAEIKQAFGTNVDFVGDNRLIFDIAGNKCRLIARVAYRHQRMMIKFVGTHEEYGKIDPEKV